ncbi:MULTISPECIES: hypothetical protein [unclassified Agarivorans]|uniref:hypothetical protein n=1 Tax=unclassified Agarivorans TaxID=2636026 RepID=UPI0026E467D3|nr:MULTISPECIES: hypothetical protein [unclassified Agarivorans]MDO6686731.1 hypothetical protein [Agarivorans sp. 3_MG-2023]MDO6716539.1 hypothetical protein [Agarivorans sp. 2_MG-2023]
MELEAKAEGKDQHPVLKLLTLNRIVGITTISVPVLYLLGYFYFYGYLSVFGVSSDFFPQTIQEHLVGAFVCIFTMAFRAFNYLSNNQWVLVISGVSGAVIFFVAVYSVLNPIKNPIASYINRKELNDKFHHYLVIPAIGGFLGSIVPYGAVCLLCLLLLFPALGHWQGKAWADRELASFQGCEQSQLSQKEKCIFLFKDNELFAEGLLLAKSSTDIAIWNGEFTEIFPTDGLRYEVRFGTKPDEEN